MGHTNFNKHKRNSHPCLFPRKTINVAQARFRLEIGRGLKIDVSHTN